MSSRSRKNRRFPNAMTVPPMNKNFQVDDDDSFEAHVLALVPLTEDEIRCCNHFEQDRTATAYKDSGPSKYKRKRSQLQRPLRKSSVDSSLQPKNSWAGSRMLETDLRDQPSLSGERQIHKTCRVSGDVGVGFGVLKKFVPRATPQGSEVYQRKTKKAKAIGEFIGVVRSSDTIRESRQKSQPLPSVTPFQDYLPGGTHIPETGQVGACVGSGSGETKKDDLNESVPTATPKGINFYKRIGRWTAHLWAEGDQHYIGSYPSASEAASAYDKASLKHFRENAQLNYQRKDYLQDIDEMAKMTNKAYRNLLKERAKASKPRHVAEGITLCPKGWYEVKIRVEVPIEEKAPPKKVRKTQKEEAPLKKKVKKTQKVEAPHKKKVKKTLRVNTEGVPIEMTWLFLGKFRTLKDAQEALRRLHPLD